MTDEIKFDRESKKILRDLIRAINRLAEAKNKPKTPIQFSGGGYATGGYVGTGAPGTFPIIVNGTDQVIGPIYPDKF